MITVDSGCYKIGYKRCHNNLSQKLFYDLISHNNGCDRFRSPESGDKISYEALSSEISCSYKVRFEDIGRCLKCECVVHDVFGRSSELAYAETDPISPGFMHFSYHCILFTNISDEVKM